MMNSFYSKYDFERIKSGIQDEYRTPFQVDRDRIIHSSEFRRLQGKTQVFLPGEYDYYRTRLTHSIEVAQIGRSICNYLKAVKKDFFGNDFYIDPDLVETVCLAHDLGNPPFGHPCEKQINRLMAPYGGYEGNAQTLRLLTEIFYKQENSKRGMNPCRATIDGVLKYKSFYSQYEQHPDNHFIYDNQKKYIEFIFDGRKFPDNLKKTEEINSFKSIECQIMDWADDSAYSINDLVDSISGGFITTDKLEKWLQKNNSGEYETKLILEMIKNIKDGSYKRKFSGEIGGLISSCNVKLRENFVSDLTNRYRYELVIDPEIKRKVKLYKKISVELVFQSSQLHQIEFKGNQIIKKIFEIMFDNYLENNESDKLLTEFTDNMINRSSEKAEKARIICDYISGMTDSYALRIYKRFFDPDYSSIADII